MSKHTVYVNNLNEKVKIEELKLALRPCSKFGKLKYRPTRPSAARPSMGCV